MNKSIRLLTLAAAALAILSSVGCGKLRARDQLNKGVTAYKNAKYEEAIDHFQQSVAAWIPLINAKMYLATAYAQQYIPGPIPRTTTKWRNRPLSNTSPCST
jgi:UDP-N-acetylglucosamine transferase subunit ALG13